MSMFTEYVMLERVTREKEKKITWHDERENQKRQRSRKLIDVIVGDDRKRTWIVKVMVHL